MGLKNWLGKGSPVHAVIADVPISALHVQAFKSFADIGLEIHHINIYISYVFFPLMDYVP